MEHNIQRILAPIELDEASLKFARQVAEFATRHGAELHLLHIGKLSDCNSRFLHFFTQKGAEEYHRLTKEKADLLQTWKRWLEKEYGITVHFSVTWGNVKKSILDSSVHTGADMIALRDIPEYLKSNLFNRSPLEQVLQESPCQVITFFEGPASMNEWKQIVMPVTDCIPETRIQAIAEIARSLHLKIHLVTVAKDEKEQQATGFYFLTETLKRLKPGGHIQVECRCLTSSSNPAASFISYARSVGADLLMTNMQANSQQHPRPKESFYFMEYA